MVTGNILNTDGTMYLLIKARHARRIHFHVDGMKYNSLKSSMTKRWTNHIRPENLNNLNGNKDDIGLKINDKFNPRNQMKCKDLYNILNFKKKMLTTSIAK